MKSEINLINNINRKAVEASGFFCSVEDASLKSLETKSMCAPNLDFFGAKSCIQTNTAITLTFGNQCEAEIFLVFRTKERVNSLDKANAYNVIESSDFWCDYEQNDPDWEFADNLSVIVTTKNKALIDTINNYDDSMSLTADHDEDGNTIFYLTEHLAGQITEYFSNYIGEICHDKNSDPTLRNDIIKNLRLEAKEMLSNAA